MVDPVLEVPSNVQLPEQHDKEGKYGQRHRFALLQAIQELIRQTVQPHENDLRRHVASGVALGGNRVVRPRQVVDLLRIEGRAGVLVLQVGKDGAQLLDQRVLTLRRRQRPSGDPANAHVEQDGHGPVLEDVAVRLDDDAGAADDQQSPDGALSVEDQEIARLWAFAEEVEGGEDGEDVDGMAIGLVDGLEQWVCGPQGNIPVDVCLREVVIPALGPKVGEMQGGDGEKTVKKARPLESDLRDVHTPEVE